MRDAGAVGQGRGIAEINHAAWSGPLTIRRFRRSEGWTDPGEAAAFGDVAHKVHGKRILDIGVGAGRTVPMLRGLSDDYTAIDFVEPMVQACRERYRDVRISWGDARHLDRMDNHSYDLVVFSWNGIDAVDHRDRLLILSEAHRVLADGGLLWFSTHNEHGPGCGEKPWTLRRSDLRHPKHLAQLVAFLPLNLYRYSTHRKHTDKGDGWSIRRAAAHNFGLVIHYASLEHERQELSDAGFETVSVRGSKCGDSVPPGEDTDSWWFHMVARKVA